MSTIIEKMILAFAGQFKQLSHTVCAPENFLLSARSFLPFISLNCTSQTFLSMSTMMLMTLVDNDNNEIIDARKGQLLETKII